VEAHQQQEEREVQQLSNQVVRTVETQIEATASLQRDCPALIAAADELNHGASEAALRILTLYESISTADKRLDSSGSTPGLYPASLSGGLQTVSARGMLASSDPDHRRLGEQQVAYLAVSAIGTCSKQGIQ